MTHITGPRKEKIYQLACALTDAIAVSDCTISEAQMALHETDMVLLKTALRPLEKYTCPTCPNPGNLTLEQINKIEDAIKQII